jgi:uncharacterized protein (TIGR01777 family)
LSAAPERVVIAGGSGLIGRALARELAAAGREVIVLSRGAPGGAGADREGVRTERWDGRTVGGWAAALEGAAAVVNLAGAGIADRRWTPARKRVLLASRLEPTAALVTALAAARHRPAVLLQASAVGFYGDRGDQPLDESAAAGAGFLAETCRAWEAASAAVERLGVRRVLLRTGVVLARDGGALPRMALPFRLGVGGRLGDGRQWLPWIHVVDQLAAMRFLLDAEGTAGPYNLVAPAPATNAEFSRSLARALGRPCLLGAPRFALELALGEMAAMLLGGQRLAPRRLLEAGYRFRHPALEGALAELFGARP